MGTSPHKVGGAGSPQKGEQTLFHNRPKRAAIVVEDVNVSQLHARAQCSERYYGRNLQYRTILLPGGQLQLGKDLLKIGSVRQIRRLSL